MKDSILITGGAGFIGSNLALNLVRRGYSVRVLDNMSKQIHGENYKNSPLYKNIAGKVELIFGDVCNKNDWIKAIDGIDILVHLAAETGTGQSMYEIEKYTSVNIQGTAQFLNIAANGKTKIKKMIVASSRAIYGEGKYSCNKHGIVYPTTRKNEDMTNGDFNVKCPYCANNLTLLPTDENSKIHPSSIYGITKQNQEQMFLMLGKALNIPAVSLRYQNVYGPGQSLSNPYTGILSIFSTRMLSNKFINIFEDGLEGRDFVYIDDVVNATVRCIKMDEANYNSFNVGTGVKTSVLTVAETLKRNYNSDSNISITGNYRIGDIRHNYADISKIKQLLNFIPTADFQTGIYKFSNWVKSQNIINDKYDASIKELREKGLLKQTDI